MEIWKVQKQLYGRKAGEPFDAAKPLLEASTDSDAEQYKSQFKPLRLQCHKLTGQILAASRDFAACETEFRAATENFPNEAGAWDMLARILDIQGKAAKAAKEKVETLRKLNNAFGF